MIRRPFLILSLILCALPGMTQLLPPGLPQIQVVRHDNSEWCDYLFTEAMNWSSSSAPNLILLLDRQGQVAWYARSPNSMTNFALQPDGRMSFYRAGEHLLLDSTFSIAGGMGCKGGYANDAHDLITTPDGRNFLICVETSVEDLSAATTIGGNPGFTQGQLASTVIQELDGSLNLVREWKARPHYQVTDCDSAYFTNPAFLDLNHTNSLEWDGRYLLISNRHNNELVLLDWDAGQIAWRLGGNHSQFSLPNDPGLSGQHDARFIGNGQISVFDNGTFHQAPLTRGLTYEPDTVAMTAVRQAEFPATGLISTAMGSFRVLPDGRVLRCNGWFAPASAANISLLEANGDPVADLYYPTDYWAYRAQCHAPTWQLQRPHIQCEPFGNGLRLYLDQTYPDYRWTTGETTASIVVQDTGRYQVFVPQGMGRLGSFEFHVANLNGQCPAVHAQEAGNPRRPAPKLLRTVDVLGREVTAKQPRRVYIELYDDGSSRKVWMD